MSDQREGCKDVFLGIVQHDGCLSLILFGVFISGLVVLAVLAAFGVVHIQQ